jgi:CRISPR system Cascade subunit CasA
MNNEKEFNLLYEPWIIVVDGNNQQLTVSMLDLFKNAHEYKGLAGELPTQDIALLRLLLAVLYAVFTKVDVDGNPSEIKTNADALGRWKSLWEKGEFPYEEIKQYLKYYEDRFWLFHPETPFYQVAGLQTDKGDTNPVTKIIADVPPREMRRFFSNRSGKQITSLIFCEAARWLIHLHAWDYAGKKASVVGGAPDGGGTGWLGKLGVVYLTGKNVFETILLNFVLLMDGAVLEFGKPVWEKEKKTPAKAEITPGNYVELLTWQSRRVRLFQNDGVVTGFLSSYGDVFEKENTFVEQMSGWHVSQLSKGKTTTNSYIPNTFTKDRILWRDLNALLPQKNQSGEVRIPNIIRWGGLLKSEQSSGIDTMNICTVGIEYGAMQGVVDELITDELSINGNLLSTLGEDWNPRILNVLDNTEKCISALAAFARELAKASGADEKDNKVMEAAASRAKELAYYSFDLPFRKWLANIDPMKDNMDQTSNLWNEQMRNQILQLGKELISDAGDNAFVGKSSIINAPSAYTKFVSNVYKIVPKIEEGKESKNE